MSNIIEIEKCNEEHSNYPCWIPTKKYGKDEWVKPHLRCNCGKYIGIGLHHVHADGRVTASVYHKRGNGKHEDPKGCEWHVHIKLKDYNLGEFLPEKDE